MKQIITFMLSVGVAIMFLTSTVNAYNGMEPEEVVKAKEKEKPKPPDMVTKGFDKQIAPQCPYTLIRQHEGSISNCRDCHAGVQWKIKEDPPDVLMDLPYGLIKIEKDLATYQIVGEIDLRAMEKLAEMFNYLDWHPCVKRVDIEILSGGGSLILAWQMIAVIESYKAKYEITTKVPGFAASAAFLIFCAGDTRLTYEHALLMHHELWQFSFFSFDDVSSSEEKARVMRLFQDNIHNYLVKRGILTAEQLDDLIEGAKDYWMTGSEAIEVGFATGYINN